MQIKNQDNPENSEVAINPSEMTRAEIAARLNKEPASSEVGETLDDDNDDEIRDDEKEDLEDNGTGTDVKAEGEEEPNSGEISDEGGEEEAKEDPGKGQSDDKVPLTAAEKKELENLRKKIGYMGKELGDLRKMVRETTDVEFTEEQAEDLDYIFDTEGKTAYDKAKKELKAKIHAATIEVERANIEKNIVVLKEVAPDLRDYQAEIRSVLTDELGYEDSTAESIIQNPALHDTTDVRHIYTIAKKNREILALKAKLQEIDQKKTRSGKRLAENIKAATIGGPVLKSSSGSPAGKNKGTKNAKPKGVHELTRAEIKERLAAMKS